MIQVEVFSIITLIVMNHGGDDLLWTNDNFKHFFYLFYYKSSSNYVCHLNFIPWLHKLNIKPRQRPKYWKLMFMLHDQWQIREKFSAFVCCPVWITIYQTIKRNHLAHKRTNEMCCVCSKVFAQFSQMLFILFSWDKNIVGCQLFILT